MILWVMSVPLCPSWIILLITIIVVKWSVKIIAAMIPVTLSTSFPFPLTLPSSWWRPFRRVLPPSYTINISLMIVVTTPTKLSISLSFPRPIPPHRTGLILSFLLTTNFHPLELLFCSYFQLYIPTTNIHPVLLDQ